jgi:hypothetical protein
MYHFSNTAKDPQNTPIIDEWEDFGDLISFRF